MSGRRTRSSTTLPVGLDGGALASTTVHPNPSRPAAAAVIRTWLLWRPPPVTSVSQPRARASAHRCSSLRALFPPPARPVQSSRFTHSEPGDMPSTCPRRSMGSSGVGRWARPRPGRAIGSDATRAPSRHYHPAMTATLRALAEATEAALDDPSLTTERATADAIRPAMAALLSDPESVL